MPPAKKKTKTRRPAKKTKAVAKLSTPMKKAVRKLIHEQDEDKYVSIRNLNENYPFPQTYTAGVAVLNPLLPPIEQGVTVNTRVGNRIVPKALIVKFTITLTGAPTTNSSEAIWGRLFVLTSKSQKDTQYLYSTVDLQQLLLDGSATSTTGFRPYQGQPDDNNYLVNKRAFNVVKDSLIKLQRGFGTLPNAGNPVSYIGDATYVSPSMQHQITVRVPCPKTLIYSDNDDLYPTNFAPFFCFGYNMPMQTNPGNAEIDYRVAINWMSHFTYEDA